MLLETLKIIGLTLAACGVGVIVAIVCVGALLVWIGRGESDVNGDPEKDGGGEP